MKRSHGLGHEMVRFIGCGRGNDLTHQIDGQFPQDAGWLTGPVAIDHPHVRIGRAGANSSQLQGS